MKRSLVLAAFTQWLFLSSSLAKALGDDPSAEQLIKLAPTIESRDGRYRNIEISGFMDGGDSVSVSFRVRRHGSDNFALYIADNSDGTPLVVFNNKRLFVYDATVGGLLYLSNANFQYIFHFADGAFIHKLLFGRSNEPCQILVDLKSLYDRESRGDVVARVDGGKFRLTRELAEGKSFVALVDPSRSCPFVQVALMKVGLNEPFILVRELNVNEDVRGAWPRLPSKERFAGKVDVLDWSADSALHAIAGVALMKRSLLVRSAIRIKGLRAAYEQRFGAQIDWDEVARKDQIVSQSIREVFEETHDTKAENLRGPATK